MRKSIAVKETADSEEKQSQVVGATSQEIPQKEVVHVVWWSAQQRESRKVGKQRKILRT